MRKLKRDKVISGDLVGVYFEDNEELLVECSPDQADNLIQLWNSLIQLWNRADHLYLETFQGIREELIKIEEAIRDVK